MGRTDALTILDLPVYEHRIAIYLEIPCFISPVFGSFSHTYFYSSCLSMYFFIGGIINAIAS
jgi:hypothetical protein